MPVRQRTMVRHCIRPLNVFSFCGEPITDPIAEYHLLTRNLPLCPACKRARDNAVIALGRKTRKPE